MPSMHSTDGLIAEHHYSIDGDVVLVRYHGALELEHVEQIHAHIERLLASHGRVYLLNDLSDSGIPGPRTRRWLLEWAADHPGAVIVNFGMSFAGRAMIALVQRASEMLGRSPGHAPRTCRDEQEARAWVDAHRQARRT